MRLTIKKGRHYSTPFPFPFPFRVRKNVNSSRSGQFKFSNSCMYDLEDEDQLDVNKLFGFSIGHHHNGSSFRFGWRALLDKKLIEIIAYEYHNGVRQGIKSICELNLNKWYNFKLTYNPQEQTTTYIVEENMVIIDVNLNKKSGWGYTLGLYFGGNRRAPQDIVIFRKKIKK